VQVSPGAPAVFTLNVESETQYQALEALVTGPSGATISRAETPGGPSVTLRLSGELLTDGVHTIILRGGTNGGPEVGKYRFEVRTSRR